MTTTSRNIQGSAEITLIARLKTGVIPITEATSYSSRLKILLGGFFDDRKSQVERDRLPEGLLERLQVIQSVRWILLNEDRDLMLAVTFDGPWEPYIRTIVDRAGPLLDVIFSHCDDYQGHSCAEGYEKFSEWVRRKQVPAMFLYNSAPSLSVDDVRYLKAFEEEFASGPNGSAGAAGGFSVQPVKDVVLRDSLNERLFKLFRVRSYFPEDGGNFTDQAYFDRCASLIFKPELADREFVGALEGSLANPQLPALNKRMLHWFLSLRTLLTPPARTVPETIGTEKVNTQSGILSPYTRTGEKGLTHGCYALVQFAEGQGKAFLSELLPQLAFEDSTDDIKITVGLTPAGLQSLGLSAAELAQFPKEFQEGAAVRAGMLGDIGANHPDNWEVPLHNWPEGSAGGPITFSTVDALLTLQTLDHRDDAGLSPKLSKKLTELSRSGKALIQHVQPTRHYHDKGHLGAVDGISQPVVHELASHQAPTDRVPPGDVLLGYGNSYGDAGPSLPGALAKGSTFMAVRKMAQDVAGYRKLEKEGDLWTALGRTDLGHPLADPENGPSNAFSHVGDERGAKCPLFAHTRRTHPRDPNQPSPRIVRRGMSYGPQYQPETLAERGVMFVAFAPSLAHQYEVILRWVNGGNSTGLLSAHPDLIAGTWPSDSSRQLYYLKGETQARLALPPKPLTQLRWSLYAFVPSRPALDALIAWKPAQLAEAAAAPAEPPPRNTQHGAPPLTPGASELKSILDDVQRRKEAGAIWAGVAAEGGVKRTDYAVLATSYEAVYEAFLNENFFSVRGYWARMKAMSDSTQYLGMDKDPQPVEGDDYHEEVRGRYVKESEAPNAFIRGISFEQSFIAAHGAAIGWLSSQKGQPLLQLRALCRRVISSVATEVFDLPPGLLSDAEELEKVANTAASTQEVNELRCPVDINYYFQHIFLPRPNPTLSDKGVERSAVVAARLEEEYGKIAESKFIQALRGHSACNADPKLERRTLVGVLGGFAIATNGSLMSVLASLVFTDRLWRLPHIDPRVVHADDLRGGMAGIEQLVKMLLVHAPAPEMVFRTATAPRRLGEVDVEPGEIVALNMGAAAREALGNGCPYPWKLLFGDSPNEISEDQRPLHYCPGQDMALGVIVGTVAALLSERGLVRVEADPLLLRRAASADPEASAQP